MVSSSGASLLAAHPGVSRVRSATDTHPNRREENRHVGEGPLEMPGVYGPAVSSQCTGSFGSGDHRDRRTWHRKTLSTLLGTNVRVGSGRSLAPRKLP